MLPLREYPYRERPMILAHRGDTSGGARENTLEAIEAAIAIGVDMIEVDVQWTLDNEFVCHHDESIDGKTVSSRTAQELDELRVTRLDAILRAGAGRTYFNLEIKEYTARNPKLFVESLLHLIERLWLSEYVLVSSFRIDFLREIKWSVPTILIRPDESMQRYFGSRSFEFDWHFEKPIAEMLPSELLELGAATGFACRLDELSEAMLADIRKYNILLSVYTITNTNEFNHALAFGARALVCDNPKAFLELRDSLFPTSERGVSG